MHWGFGDYLYNLQSYPLALTCMSQSKLHGRFSAKILYASLLCWICATRCTLAMSFWVRCGGSSAAATAAASHVDNAYPNRFPVSTILDCHDRSQTWNVLQSTCLLTHDKKQDKLKR